ncbi:Flagellar biosynthetic protein FliP [Andreprevotia sp. IGB-42]|uniref:flagellar type III secretion system pore protein FliP n=1 Tax=Andreprevotia sp. IGB-42 TaxID=2497473 RepID=UPI0013591BA9|nr:flagellar type III secretion system pore protein FliP [Andreprevotia sp. IGB-42]KAF0813387.1 Flagellar biosynthetic protein FliP [Andreprevotia sp. IGB-42]
MRIRNRLVFSGLACLGLLLVPSMALSADLLTLPGVQIGAGGSDQASTGLKLLLALTVLSLVPAILISMTGFVRIVIVLSLLRHALGMQETPPNTVLMSLALFLTLFTMSPALTQANQQAFQPYLQGKLAMAAAIEKGVEPFREFMIRQTREEDLALLVEISKSPQPRTMADIGNLQLIPAFMLSELRTAFQIGFVIFLPFLLIDLIVSAILMGMGMMMVPPVTISLPLKLLMFVMIDGWNIVVRSLLSSFH